MLEKYDVTEHSQHQIQSYQIIHHGCHNNYLIHYIGADRRHDLRAQQSLQCLIVTISVHDRHKSSKPHRRPDHRRMALGSGPQRAIDQPSVPRLLQHNPRHRLLPHHHHSRQPQHLHLRPQTAPTDRIRPLLLPCLHPRLQIQD